MNKQYRIVNTGAGVLNLTSDNLFEVKEEVYTEFNGLITQTAKLDPIIVVFQNTTQYIPAFSFFSAGTYRWTVSNEDLTTNMVITIPNVSANANISISVSFFYDTEALETQVTIFTRFASSGIGTDGMLLNTPINIKFF